MDIDAQLVGHWRHTHSQSSGGFSMATDTHYRLGPDGRFSYSSRTVGSAGESSEGPLSGRWGVQDGRLHIVFEQGEQVSGTYQVSATQLFLPEEEHFRLWDRIA
jgi:hypothetical protein